MAIQIFKGVKRVQFSVETTHTYSIVARQSKIMVKRQTFIENKLSKGDFGFVIVLSAMSDISINE